MIRKTVQSIRKKKPYLLDPWRVRSYNEARLAWEQRGYPRAATVLARARIKSGKTPEEWNSFLGMNPQQIAAYEQDMERARRVSRKGFVLGILLAVLALFFACTPIGRSIVREAYHSMVQFLDEHLLVYGSGHDIASMAVPSVPHIEISSDHNVMQLSTIEEAKQYIQNDIFVLSDYLERLERIDLYYPSNINQYIQCTYMLEEGLAILAEQTVGETPAEILTAIEGKETEYVHISTRSNLIIDGIFMEEDTMFVGTMLMDDIKVTIKMDNVTNKELISTYLSSLKLI